MARDYDYEECEQDREDHLKSLRRLKGPLIASMATIGGSIAVGNGFAWTSVVLPELKRTGDLGPLSPEQESWIGSMLAIGALAAGLSTGMLIDKFGRKMTLLGVNFPMLLGWLLIIFAQTPTTMIIGRFFTGFGVGCLTLVIPIYITECTEERLRGAIASTFPISWAFGMFFINFAGWIQIGWLWLSIICSTACVSLFLCMLWVPESPVFYVRRGRDADGERAIKWLRGITASEATKEYSKLKHDIQNNEVEGGLSLRDFAKRPILKPTLISIFLFVFQQFSGFNAVIFYMVDIFDSAGGDLDPTFCSMMVCGINIISVCFTSAVTDKLGRRLLLLISTVGITISLVALGMFFFLKEIGGGETPQNLSWLPLTSLLTYMISFNFGMGPMPFLLMGEILPSHVKGIVSSMGISVMWFLIFLITKTFDGMSDALGAHGCFWLFAGVSAIGLVFTFIFVKETKGKNIDQIYKLYS